MAAQHLPRDLVRPGSGSEEFAQTMKNDMPSHTKHSFTSSASSHHAERIYCNITESWKLQSVVSPPQEIVPTPLYYKFSVPLNFCLYHFHMHWVNIQSSAQIISYPPLHQVKPARKALRVSAPTP